MVEVVAIPYVPLLGQRLHARGIREPIISVRADANLKRQVGGKEGSLGELETASEIMHYFTPYHGVPEQREEYIQTNRTSLNGCRRRVVATAVVVQGDGNMQEGEPIDNTVLIREWGLLCLDKQVSGEAQR